MAKHLKNSAQSQGVPSGGAHSTPARQSAQYGQGYTTGAVRPQVAYARMDGGVNARYKNQEAREKRSFSVISTILLILGIGCILVAAGMWIYAQVQYAQQSAINEKLAAYATVSDDSVTAPVVDWEGLKAINDDVVGWLQIPGTNVDYPVYQGADNNEYLRTNAEGEYSIGGQIFMDYENAKPGLVDRQTLIYGHHLNNGEMFTIVDDMCNQEVFDQYDTIWYVTENETYELEPLFIYKSAATNGEARQSTFASTEDFHEYLSGLLSEASAQSATAESSINNVTKVLTLCTCDYDNDFGQGNGRSLLVCALKSEVE